MSKVFIQESTLTAIGDAIRTQTGGTDLIAPGDMPTQILAIEGGTGGGGYEPTDEELTLTGDCQYRFAYGGWDWVLREYGDRIVTEEVFGVQYMFSGSQVTEIPFDINCEPLGDMIATGMFQGCNKLRSIGAIRNATFIRPGYMFSSCKMLRYLPTFENVVWNSKTQKYHAMNSMFSDCYSLRSIPEELLKELYCLYTSSSSHYGDMFYNCHALDEIRGVPVPVDAAYTSNMFGTTFFHNWRVKDIIFDTDNGTPYTVAWNNQTINLTQYIGYGYEHNQSVILDFNSGITRDKEVTDSASYAALKDDPDWYTVDLAYSRYNKQSAINTINSLPTTTGTGCTIKFKTNAGSGISGGRIGAMSESDIAVAAAKGWTVTLVD